MRYLPLLLVCLAEMAHVVLMIEGFWKEALLAEMFCTLLTRLMETERWMLRR